MRQNLLFYAQAGGILFFFLIVFDARVFAQEGWIWQNPLPQGNDLNIVQFVDRQYGWIVTEGPTLMRTGNGGQTWEILYIDIFLDKIQFLNSRLGWAVGREEFANPNRHVYHTTDGGQSWQRQLEGPEPEFVFSLFFLDSLRGWISGCLKIYHTADGGKTWITQGDSLFRPNCLNGVTFKDSLHGWAYGLSWGIRTEDGGQTWVSDAGSPPGRKMVFIDSTHGWLASARRLRRTIDGGRNWEMLPDLLPPLSDENIEDLIALERNKLLLSTYKGLYASNDGGFSWEKYTDQPLGKMAFLDSLNAWAVGPEFPHDPAQYRSTDGGRTWEKLIKNFTQDKSVLFNDVDFVNSNVGWALGTAGLSQSRYLAKTTDGGSNWEEFPTPGNNRLHAVQFLDTQQGWLVGNNGSVFYTADGGSTWKDLSINTSDDIGTVHFYDTSRGWAIGSSFELEKGAIWKTSDGGLNWVNLSPLDMKRVEGAAFIDTLYVWIVTGGGSVTDAGSIWHTNDGGQSWERQLPDNPSLDFRAIAFADTNVGWAVGFDYQQGGVIYATNNGGKTWGVQSVISFTPLDITAFNQQRALIVGFSGHIIATSDGGQTWIEQRSPTSNFLEAVDFFDAQTGWIVGWRSTILHTKTGGPIAVEERPTLRTQPKSFRLLSNYPNPFTLNTQVAFELYQNSRAVDLTFYNLLGRKVRTISSVALSPGRHALVWDGRDDSGIVLPSGIYFYRLQVEQEWQTGKVVLAR